jgi:hypothetical protein
MLLRKLERNAKTANWELPFGGNFGNKINLSKELKNMHFSFVIFVSLFLYFEVV